MVAAAESADVIARWTPLEKNGSIKADLRLMSEKTCMRLWTILTSSISYNPVAVAGVGRRRVAEITGTFDTSKVQHASGSDEFYYPGCTGKVG